MDNLNSSNTKLTEQEKIRFTELTEKILERQSLISVFSASENEEFFQILQKINLFLKEQDRKTQEENKVFPPLVSLVLKLFSVTAIILLILVAPLIITIIISQNINQSFTLTIFAAILALLLSSLALMAFFGKFQWTWVFSLILITFFLTLLFSIL